MSVPQLNQLLHWAVANTPGADGRPVSSSSAPRGALHPSDPAHPQHVPSVSPASEPAEQPKPRKDLDTGVLDVLMGQSDAVTMKEKMGIMRDQERGVEERVSAMDDFEMLIEQIDNANNLEPMGMWPALLELLEDGEDEVVQYACWICGTAIQNNEKAQVAFHARNPLPLIYSLIGSTHPRSSSHAVSPATRSKALYCLSAALKHYPGAATALSLNENAGWLVLRDGLRDPEAVIRRRVAFLINTLLLQSDEPGVGGASVQPLDSLGRNELLAALQSHGIIDALVRAIAAPLPAGPDGDAPPHDWDFFEKVVRALGAAEERGGVAPGQKREVGEVWARWGKEGRWEDLGFSDEEGQGVQRQFPVA